MLNKDQKIESYTNDIDKLNNMIQILDSSDNLHGALYSEILEAIKNTKAELERILNNIK